MGDGVEGTQQLLVVWFCFFRPYANNSPLVATASIPDHLPRPCFESMRQRECGSSMSRFTLKHLEEMRLRGGDGALAGGLDRSEKIVMTSICEVDQPDHRLRLTDDDGFGNPHGNLTVSSKRLHKETIKRCRFAVHRKDKRKAQRAKHKQLVATRNHNKAEVLHHRRQIYAEKQAFQERRNNTILRRGCRLQRVVIDVGFPGAMTDSECSSLASQIAFCHGANRKCELPLDLHAAFSHRCLREWAAMARFQPQQWEASSGGFGAAVGRRELSDLFPAQDCVYLTADADLEIATLDPDKVYVIGGLVDRNRHKRAGLRRAESLGIATARLPIERHFTLKGHVVLTVNHVVELLRLVSAGGGWGEALSIVLPRRRVAEEKSTGGSQCVVQPC